MKNAQLWKALGRNLLLSIGMFACIFLLLWIAELFIFEPGTLLKWHAEGEPFLCGFIQDQRPDAKIKDKVTSSTRTPTSPPERRKLPRRSMRNSSISTWRRLPEDITG